MRSALLTSSLLAAATVVSARACGQQNIEDLVASNACGDSTLISQCLQKVDVFNLDEVVPCFAEGGCTEKDAAWFTESCATPEPRQGLKRNDATTTDAKAAPTPHMILAVRQTTAAQTTAAAAATTGSSTSLICSTTFQSVIDSCVTSTLNGNIASTCSKATITTSSCAASMLCFNDERDASLRVCMIRDDKLSTGGLVVAICFVLALIGTIGSLIVMAQMEKSKAKRLARERVALLGGSKKAMEDIETAKPYRIGGGGDSGDAGEAMPTMPAGGSAPQIKLHQGIDGLPQQSQPGDQHWSNDYANRR